jgi:hypothetical protein
VSLSERSPVVIVSETDSQIVAWARRHRYNCYYADETGLPPSCLKVHLGPITAWFHRGRLARLAVQVEGDMIADTCDSLQELLAVCAEWGACPAQPPIRMIPPVRRRCISAN